VIRRTAALVATVAAVVAGVAAPAHADDEIGLSVDGVTWSTQLAAPLFPPGFLWVPGDVEEATFLVRNDGPSAGELTVDVIAEDPDAFLASDALVLEARLGNGTWTDVQPGTTRVDPAQFAVAEGQSTSVTVRGTFLPEATAQEDSIVPFRVRVTMSGDGDVGGVDAGDGGGEVGGVDDGILPDTGSPIALGLLWLVAGLIGAGVALVLPRRQRRGKVPSHG
jgi:hypothetical protein